MNFQHVIKLYESYLKSMGRAYQTIRGYLSIINNFYRRLNGKDIFNLEDKDFHFYLNESNKSQHTLLLRISVLKMFFNWLVEEHYILKNPLLNFDKLRRPKLLPKKIMTPGEVFKMMESLPLKESDSVQFRDRVILELMYSCSLRRSELVALNKNDYDSSTRSLRVTAHKTQKGRLVPVGKYVSELLDMYLQEYRPNSTCEALFLTDRKKSRLSAQTITCKVGQLRKKSKIRTKASSHSFRKSSATHMLRNGASLLTVQALLGHAAITSTQAYTKLYPKDLIKMHRANHPREKHKNIQLPELKVPFFLYGKVRFQHQ